MSKELFQVLPEDYNKLLQYFSLRHPGTCESNILEAYLWKEYYNPKYYLNEKGLMWIYEMQQESFTVLPLCKNEDLKYCFEDIKNYFNQELGKKLVLYLADEEAVNILNLSEEEYIVEEDRRYFDYVYDDEKLRKLILKKYNKKKNHVNAFLKEYEGRFEFKRLNCQHQEEVLEFLNIWKDEREIDDEYNRVDYEALGIEYIYKNCNMLKSIVGGIYIDGKLEAFSIGSYSEVEKLAYIHVEKANPNIRGLYPYINQQFLIHCFPEAQTVNREDDMGLEGLRKAKLSYHPIDLVKKYNIIQM